MPDAAALVTPEDVSDYMGGAGFTTTQQDACADIIDGIVGEIEAYLGRPVLVEERTEWARTGWLEATPVTVIYEVDGIAYNLTSPGRYANGHIGYAANVRYAGGLAANPSARRLLRITILRAAAREMTNRHDDTVSVKDLDVREPGSSDGQTLGDEAEGLSEKAFPALRRWKRHNVFQRAGFNR